MFCLLIGNKESAFRPKLHVFIDDNNKHNTPLNIDIFKSFNYIEKYISIIDFFSFVISNSSLSIALVVIISNKYICLICNLRLVQLHFQNQSI